MGKIQEKAQIIAKSYQLSNISKLFSKVIISYVIRFAQFTDRALGAKEKITYQFEDNSKLYTKFKKALYLFLEKSLIFVVTFITSDGFKVACTAALCIAGLNNPLLIFFSFLFVESILEIGLTPVIEEFLKSQEGMKEEKNKTGPEIKEEKGRESYIQDLEAKNLELENNLKNITERLDKIESKMKNTNYIEVESERKSNKNPPQEKINK